MVLHILHIFPTMSKVSIRYISKDIGQKYDITANRVVFKDFSPSGLSVYPKYTRDHSDYIYLKLGWGE